MAAGLTAAVIVIAVVAAFIVAHQRLVGSAPAGPDPNVKAYRDMIASDYNAMAASTSSHCNTIQDTGCEAALNAVSRSLQKWVSDLGSYRTTPAGYSVVDGQLRRHLNQAIADMNVVVATQKADNQNGFNLAVTALLYERAWIDPTMFAIVGSYPRVAATYHDAFGLAKQSLQACINSTPAPADLGCSGLLGRVCTNGSVQICASDIQTADTQVQMFLIALLQNPAPSALTTKNAQLEVDLANADTALLALTDALLHGDSAKLDAGELAYSQAISSADGDTAVIGTA